VRSWKLEDGSMTHEVGSKKDRSQEENPIKKATPERAALSNIIIVAIA